MHLQSTRPAGVDPSIARGLVRERMRKSMAAFEAGRRQVRTKGRLGAQVRALRGDLRDGQVEADSKVAA